MLSFSVVLSIVGELYLLDYAFQGSLLAGAVVVVVEFAGLIAAALYIFRRTDASSQKRRPP